MEATYSTFFIVLQSLSILYQQQSNVFVDVTNMFKPFFEDCKPESWFPLKLFLPV